MTNEPPTPDSEPEPPPAAEAGAVPTEAPAGVPDIGAAPPSSGAPPPPRHARLARSRSNRVVSGVAGGLGEYFEVDPTLVRVAIIVLTIISGGLFALVYIAAVIIMPRSEQESSPLAGARGSAAGRNGVNAIAIVFGLILIVIGISRLVQATDLPEFRWVAVLSVVLGLIGLALVVESRRGVSGGLVAVGVVLSVVLAVATAIPSANWDSGFGDRTVRPITTASLERSYDHAFGSMIVDLRDLPLPEGKTRVNISIAFGDLSVRVPSDVGVRVTGTTVFGSSYVLGHPHDGITADIDEQTDGYDSAPRRLEIELSNAFGSATVR